MLKNAKNDAVTRHNPGAVGNIQGIGRRLRIKIVTALLDREHCVCDLSVLCGQSESAVSHQLRVLRTLRIVKNRRQGKIVYYSLDDDHVRSLIQMSIEHISH